MITVAVFKWGGYRDIPKEAIRAARNMYAQHLTIPHRFLCITDDPRGLDCETAPLWSNPGKGLNCYPRLKLWHSSSRALGEKFLMSDVDLLLRGNIDHLVTDDPCKVFHYEPYSTPDHDFIAGCLQMITPGVYEHIWEDFTPEGCQARVEAAKAEKWPLMGSDQAWLALTLPKDIPKWTQADGIFIKRPDLHKIPKEARMVQFVGSMKPWNTEYREEWLTYACV